MATITTVDEYIAAAPREVQSKLKELRKIIISVAPEAEERISYAMPYYGYKGTLAYFSVAKNHVGLYIPPPVIAKHMKLLTRYKTATSTVQFSLDKKLPVTLIKTLVKVRMKINDQSAAAKEKK